MTFVICLGILVGMVSALLGLGGGVFMVPLLPWVAGLSTSSAVATSLFTVFLVSSFNTLSYSLQNLVRWKVALSLGVPSAVFAFFVSKSAIYVGEIYIKLVLLFILVIMAIKTLLGGSQFGVKTAHQKKSTGLLLTAGMGAGSVSGLTGIGSGLIIAPLMITMNLVKPKELAPTSNGAMMMTTFAATLGYVLVGSESGTTYVSYHLSFALFVSAVCTSLLIRKYQQRVSGSQKAYLLFAVICSMIVKVSYSLF